MKMSNLKLIFYTTLMTHLSIPVWTINDNTLLLMISFDGFRYDYLDRHLTPTLMALKKNSSYAHYMIPQFPSLTLTNHHSMATGLYPEVHGILDNKVYDEKTKRVLQYGYELYHYNDDVVPLWIQNEDAGGNRTSGCLLWPGCPFTYQDKMPTYNFIDPLTTSEFRIDLILGWFTDPVDPANLAMAHFENPDQTCHRDGPDSVQVDETIVAADHIVRYLLQRVEEVGLSSRLNIILLSDHGCVNVHEPDYMIDLNQYVDRTSYKRAGEPPNCQVYPEAGRELEVLEALKRGSQQEESHFTTYRREEIPERYHFKNCERAPPILLTAELGYLFVDTPTTEPGQHGYDPRYPPMRAFFMATGPLFKRDFKIEPFENIHVFPLASHILGLPIPTIPPNGTLSQLQSILKSHTTCEEEKISQKKDLGYFSHFPQFFG